MPPAATTGRRRRGDRLFNRRGRSRQRAGAWPRAGPRRDRHDRLAGRRKRRAREWRRSGIGVVAAPNFAIGVNCSWRWPRMRPHCWPRSRTSAPGFTSCTTRRSATRRPARRSRCATAMQQAGYSAADRVASTRAGVDSRHPHGRVRRAAETITLTHTARDRAAFARGALEAARWVNGRRGWFTMRTFWGCSRTTRTMIARSERMLGEDIGCKTARRR